MSQSVIHTRVRFEKLCGMMKRSILFRESKLNSLRHTSNWRSRRSIFSRLAPIAALVLGFSGCLHYSSGPSGPPPEVTIAQVKDLRPITTNPDILGRDGGNSALFQGFSVWLYSDTFLAKPDEQDRTLISDSWSYTTDLNAQDGITGFQERLDSTGAPTMILPETATEAAFNQQHNVDNCQAQPCGARWALWINSIVVNPSDNSALIFYMVVSAQPGAFNFQIIGTSVAVWKNFQQQPERPTLNPPIVVGHPDLLFDRNEPEFGTAAVVSSGTLYVYGCGIATNSLDVGCRLGKVDPSSAQDRGAWTFYAGKGKWSSNVRDAVAIFAGGGSVAWNNYLQQYVAVYSQVFSQNVLLRTAPNPEGPWSGSIVAFVALPPSSGNVYDARAHSEYDANGGQTIFVSYSRSTPAPFSSEVRLVSLTLQESSSSAQ
jgi:hypothetical protein